MADFVGTVTGIENSWQDGLLLVTLSIPVEIQTSFSHDPDLGVWTAYVHVPTTTKISIGDKIPFQIKQGNNDVSSY